MSQPHKRTKTKAGDRRPTKDQGPADGPRQPKGGSRDKSGRSKPSRGDRSNHDEGKAVDAPRLPKPVLVNAPHPATLEDVALLKQCEVGFGRTSGPGGQHRNRRSTSATLVHQPTGLHGSASERRSQAENRKVALRRLRLTLALRARTKGRFKGLSVLWTSRRQGKQMSINPRHRDYPALLSEALDCINAHRWDVAKAAGTLGISMSQLTRLLRHHPAALDQINQVRISKGLPRLRR